jgi:hypothetical protein
VIFTSDIHAALPHNAAMKTGSVPHPLSDSVIFTLDSTTLIVSNNNYVLLNLDEE